MKVLCTVQAMTIAMTLALLCAVPQAARAQLATSFYNVTGIRTKVLPNAVQVVIETDGTVLFGGDINEFVETSDGRFDPKTVTSLRLRLVRARARLPAYVDIGAYPVDAAAITLGRDDLSWPVFTAAGRGQPEPRVDIELRFFVPLTVRRFIVDRTSGNSDGIEDNDVSGINFGDYLRPLEVGVEMGRDRRSIVVTVITDRTDAGGAARLQRSPAAQHKRRLAVTPLDDSQFRLEVLHTPLTEVLDAVSRAAKLPLAAREEVAGVDISLLLPMTTMDEFLRALGNGYGLNVLPRAAHEGGGFIVGRGRVATSIERLPLRHLEPERARLLFPDFLLPILRADKENNALLVSGSPQLVARLRRDLELLDRPAPQVRVDVTAWELSSTDDLNFALRAAYNGRKASAGLNVGAGQIALRLEENQQRALSATIEALSARGRARLHAKPFVVVNSGARGTVFLGQARFITVLQTRAGRQDAQALRLQIGYSLTVAPTVGAQDDITLWLNPRVSTVDAIEAGTGLPTLGIRETTSVLRVRPQQTVVIAGLDSDLDFATRRSTFLRSTRRDQSRTALLLLVKAQKL